MDCQLNVKPFKQCCCQCTMQTEVVTNVGSQHVGHVCRIMYDMYSDGLEASPKMIWQPGGPHSVGCEMFTDKRKIKDDNTNTSN